MTASVSGNAILFGGSNNYSSFIEFQVNADQGTELDIAFLQLRLYSSTGDVNITVSAYDGSFSTPHTESEARALCKSNYVSTSASINYTLPYETGSYYKVEIDIKDIIKEVVDRADWVANKYILLRLLCTSGTATSVYAGTMFSSESIRPYLIFNDETYSGIGAGTELDPFIITTPNEFVQIISFPYRHWSLANDIDFESSSFPPICYPIYTSDGYNVISYISAFTGSLNGNGHKIINPHIDIFVQYPVILGGVSDVNIGLFGMVCGSITNLLIDKLSINLDCAFLLDEFGEPLYSGVINIGGFAGHINEAPGVSIPNISKVGVIGDITVSNAPSNNFNIGKFSGIIGGFTDTHLAGNAYVSECFSNIKILITSPSPTYDWHLVGGFAGSVEADAYVSDCYSKGDIVYILPDGIEQNPNIGGFCGENRGGIISRCYCSTTRISNTYSGFCGYTYSGTISSCYFNSTITGVTSSSGGTSKTTSQMNTQSTYVDWDFNNVWLFTTGQPPTLINCPEPPEITHFSNGDLFTGGTPISGGDYSTNVKENAFDGDLNTLWSSSQSGSSRVGTAYIGYDFGQIMDFSSPTPILGRLRREILTKIIYYNSGTSSQNLSSVKLQYSEDGANWFDCCIYSTPTTANATVTLNIYNKFPYLRYIRLLANSGNFLSGRWTVKDIECYGYSSWITENGFEIMTPYGYSYWINVNGFESMTRKGNPIAYGLNSDQLVPLKDRDLSTYVNISNNGESNIGVSYVGYDFLIDNSYGEEACLFPHSIYITNKDADTSISSWRLQCSDDGVNWFDFPIGATEDPTPLPIPYIINASNKARDCTVVDVAGDFVTAYVTSYGGDSLSAMFLILVLSYTGCRYWRLLAESDPTNVDKIISIPEVEFIVPYKEYPQISELIFTEPCEAEAEAINALLKISISPRVGIAEAVVEQTPITVIAHASVSIESGIATVTFEDTSALIKIGQTIKSGPSEALIESINPSLKIHADVFSGGAEIIVDGIDPIAGVTKAILAYAIRLSDSSVEAKKSSADTKTLTIKLGVEK